MLTRRSLIKLLASGFVAAVGSVAYPFLEAFAKPRIQSYRLTPKRWTTGLSLKICVIADMHACRPWMDGRRVASICDQAQALDADMILLLGDYMPAIHKLAEPIAVEDWSTPLGRLRAPLGVHAVLGNHDYWSDIAFQRDPSREPLVRQALQAAGVSVLINQALRLEKDGRAFWLAGLGDQIALLARYGHGYGRGVDDLRSTLSQVTDDAPVIMMAHEPDIFLDPDPRVSVTLSGHTHGGQVNLFGWRPVNASYGSAIYPAGLFREAQGDLIVSRGLGCSSLPIRLGSWPEILLIELG